MARRADFDPYSALFLETRLRLTILTIDLIYIRGLSEQLYTVQPHMIFSKTITIHANTENADAGCVVVPIYLWYVG